MTKALRRRRKNESSEASALPEGVVPVTVRAGDVLDEVLASTLRRPMRTFLTALGTGLGVAAFVATLGLTGTAQTQVSARFDALKATEVLLQDTSPESASTMLPDDTERRLAQIDGVLHSAVAWNVFERPPQVQSLLRSGIDAPSLGVIAVSPGYFPVVNAQMSSGTAFGEFHDQRSERVAVLGRTAANRLQIPDVERQPVIFVGGVGFTVVGIVDDVATQGESLFSVMIPERTAAAVFAQQSMPKQSVVIRTRPGAAQMVGAQAALAVRPEDPQSLLSITPPDPKSLRQQIEGDVAGLFAALGIVCLVVGAVAIANTTLVSVMERVWEIGLRRALGATRRAIIVQFLAETTAIGLLGSVVGACLGVVVLVAVSALRDWAPVIPFWLPFAGLSLGAMAGLLAGIYPAWKAGAIAPVEALRR